MHEGISEVIAPYRGRDVLVDTNLLLLLFIGRFDVRRIASFKRTQMFVVEDFMLLTELLETFGSVLTTPNVLTEVSNLAGSLPAPQKAAFFARFSDEIKVLVEAMIPSIEASSTPAFARFGLTDSVIEQVAQDGIVVLTADFALSGYLRQRGLTSFNFNHFRFLR